MEKSEFDAEIRKSWAFMDERLGIGRSALSFHSLPVDLGFRNIALDEHNTYREIYLSGLNKSHYNIILYDSSYLQFSITDEAEWRLAFMPNPWLAGIGSALAYQKEIDKMVECGKFNTEEANDLIADLPYHLSIPPIRFECSVSQYKQPHHPEAHFHIGRDANNRWPCSVRIGPLTFSMLIARLYYTSFWLPKSKFVDKNIPGTCIDDDFARNLSSDKVVQKFSEIEKITLHLAKYAPENKNDMGFKKASRRNKK